MTLAAYRKLSSKDRDELWEAITVIEAQDFLSNMKLVMVPKLKKEAREKLHKNMVQKAFPKDSSSKGAKITLAEIQRVLAKRA